MQLFSRCYAFQTFRSRDELTSKVPLRSTCWTCTSPRPCRSANLVRNTIISTTASDPKQWAKILLLLLNHRDIAGFWDVTELVMGVIRLEVEEGAGVGKLTEGGKEKEKLGTGKGEVPLYTLQALWDGKMKVKDFEVVGVERPTLPHNVYEQDEALPVIDVAALVGADKAARAENLARMLDAAKSWGFFKIRNHGIPLEVVKKVERNVKKFFALPMDKKLMVKAINFSFGYVGGSPVDWRYKWWLESLHMKVKEEAIRNMVNLVWSDDKEFARECILDLLSYFGTMRDLSRLVVECLTEGLGLKPDTYTRLETDDAICNARVNHYPACPDPSKVFGIPAHTDPQMLSILYQDDVGGLQVLRDGKWIGIRPDDSTFVVNLGDTFQAITNGILHSAAHRVAVNKTRSRYATIYFYGIDNVQQLRVPPELVTEERPLKYRPFTVNEYRDHVVSYQVPMDGVKYLQIKPETEQAKSL